ncbi:MAG TPA: NAD(+)/NADH kinase [Solirubrobacteraceae bacterium]|jgi:NAD+ kinase|nr:NAD(+)/NADH kinase [Solirubrobacteraceae bacterium]
MSRQFTVFTHGRLSQTAPALGRLIAQARKRGVLLRFDAQETEKHRLTPQEGVLLDAEPIDEVELCFVLGGDGTILRALRRYGASDVPVFAINFGEIGFLATIEPEHIEEGFDRAIDGEFELLQLPAILLDKGVVGAQRAFNDVAVHRKIGERVAELSYSFDGQELGSVRCDGLVVATPAGSTGYNLANGGPVMAWGVEGFVVSFIAPHSLTARALVMAPADRLIIHNRSREPLDIALDGRPVGEMPADGEISVSFLGRAGTIAQLPGTSFYRRLREKFGRLAR